MFAALEFFAERYLLALTRVESTVVDFIIVLVVIVSARVVHTRVDRAVDNILFRTRHAQELALARYATTAQFYTSTKPLIRDTLETVGQYALVDGTAVYLAANGALAKAGSSWPEAPAEIEENDVACADMRAHQEPLDLHDLATAFPGVRAYPMILAGRLVGVLSIGNRAGGEAIPPDIDEAVANIAGAIAIAVAAIETDAIREENALLQRRLNALAAV
jgi:GAF domain-containing protein